MSNVTYQRLMSEKDAQAYLGLKRGKCREFAEECNAVKHIGSRVLYDRYVLDEVLNSGTEFCVKEKSDPEKVLAASAK